MHYSSGQAELNTPCHCSFLSFLYLYLPHPTNATTVVCFVIFFFGLLFFFSDWMAPVSIFVWVCQCLYTTLIHSKNATATTILETGSCSGFNFQKSEIFEIILRYSEILNMQHINQQLATGSYFRFSSWCTTATRTSLRLRMLLWLLWRRRMMLWLLWRLRRLLWLWLLLWTWGGYITWRWFCLRLKPILHKGLHWHCHQTKSSTQLLDDNVKQLEYISVRHLT